VSFNTCIIFWFLSICVESYYVTRVIKITFFLTITMMLELDSVKSTAIVLLVDMV